MFISLCALILQCDSNEMKAGPPFKPYNKNKREWSLVRSGESRKIAIKVIVQMRDHA